MKKILIFLSLGISALAQAYGTYSSPYYGSSYAVPSYPQPSIQAEFYRPGCALEDNWATDYSGSSNRSTLGCSAQQVQSYQMQQYQQQQLQIQKQQLEQLERINNYYHRLGY